MIQSNKVLAVIPARGGSKGVPRKNVRPLAGKPLLAWTIEQARKSKYIDRLILSSEDREIIDTARNYGCDVPFERPKELAQDDTPGIAPILHALEHMPGYDYVVLLQPTSPLRTADDIDGCIERCVEHEAPACVSVTESDQSPYWMYTLNEAHRMTPVLPNRELYARRQDLPQAYALNGAVYVAECTWLHNQKTFLSESTVAYAMPKQRSLDIDHETDFVVAEALMKYYGPPI